MKYNLRLTSPHRVRWLVWLSLGLLGILVAWVSYASEPGLLVARLSVFLFAYTVVAALFLLFFWNLLLRQRGWVELTSDSVAWANPAASPPGNYPLAQIRAYRFIPTKNGLGLRLYLRNGEKVHIEGKYSDEFSDLWRAFDQTVRLYNQANPEAEVKREDELLVKFFKRSISTKVLVVLLAVSAAWIGWCVSQDADLATHFPVHFLLSLVALPYLLLWVATSDQRE